MLSDVCEVEHNCGVRARQEGKRVKVGDEVVSKVALVQPRHHAQHVCRWARGFRSYPDPHSTPPIGVDS